MNSNLVATGRRQPTSADAGRGPEVMMLHHDVNEGFSRDERSLRLGWVIVAGEPPQSIHTALNDRAPLHGRPRWCRRRHAGRARMLWCTGWSGTARIGASSLRFREPSCALTTFWDTSAMSGRLARSATGQKWRSAGQALDPSRAPPRRRFGPGVASGGRFRAGSCPVADTSGRVHAALISRFMDTGSSDMPAADR